MPAKSFHFVLATAAFLGLGLTPAAAQLRLEVASGKVQAPDRPDELKAMVKEVQEAYKAPFEVDQDIRDELRKQYQNPSPEREQKILREARRLYATTPEQEERIVRELRRSYEVQSGEQEDRLFAEIRRGGKLPIGTVPASVQTAQAERFFQRFDTNRDGVLGSGELPDGLVANIGRWDANRDGSIDTREYWAYYQSSLRTVSEKVASGEISVKLPNGALPPKPAAATEEDSILKVFRAGKLPPGLPEWFTRLDTDFDGQIGLYEWRTDGRKVEEFTTMDLNEDGLIPAEEYLRWKKSTEAAAIRGVQESQTPPRFQPGQPSGTPAVTVKSTGGKPFPVEMKVAPGGEKKLEKQANIEGKEKVKPTPGEKK